MNSQRVGLVPGASREPEEPFRVKTARSEPIESQVARILDANLNRAREAARVMEDYARFVLDDAGLTEQGKRIRHDLAAALADAGLGNLVRSRDIAEDVGREIQTSREYARSDAADVVTAAGQRLSEALRVIEEYGKTVDANLGRAVERLRYRGYELERRVRICLEAAARFGHVRLYVLLTESLCSGNWFATAKAAVHGGADCLQLREKGLPDGELLERARRLADLCHEHSVLFVANDRADIAAACHADGLHLGRDDLPVRDARRVLGPGPLIGTSTHTVEQAETAIAECPDYIAVGPMFATATKPQPHIPGPELVRRVREMTSLPVAAIGGITDQNVRQVLDAGGRCICACSAVISQANVAEAARRLKGIITEATESDSPPR